MFAGLAETGGPGTPLALRGRALDARMMLRAGAGGSGSETLVTIRAGAVILVEDGPLVMPSWDFAISAAEEDWALFLRAVPPPGSHDLMALLKRGAMRFEGNLHPLMSNLLYFKLLLASLRPQPETAPEATA
ncbi:hypothetical protein SAMN05444336_105105 [Albimonas donghaensis]|uniref:SCP-2 sterol transfer family protein n=1 Tax=Albimonas donghaensis TaxID=356660 RepID=A0A1H3BPP1_9RHOB|nr:hypothetical protein [Albimonas donghaensis]SDX43691.1 hypothetical protein SAMN05444336_105105 [Albimonas donghaensis]